MQIKPDEIQLEFDFAPAPAETLWQVLGAFMLGETELTLEQIYDKYRT